MINPLLGKAVSPVVPPICITWEATTSFFSTCKAWYVFMLVLLLIHITLAVNNCGLHLNTGVTGPDPTSHVKQKPICKTEKLKGILFSIVKFTNHCSDYNNITTLSNSLIFIIIIFQCCMLLSLELWGSAQKKR